MSAITTPGRSLQQRMDALEHANDIRSQRARLKRDIKAGRQDVLSLLADPPGYLLTMKVYDLLLAAPKLGRVKVSCILSQCRVSPSKTVGGLTWRQRDELRGCVRRRGLL